MPFYAHLCLINEIISRISQNDLHIQHNGHICQICKIIRVKIELAILAFILPTSGHANFEYQHMPLYFLVKLAYQEIFLQAKTALKQWEALVHQSHLVSNDEGIRLTTYLDMAQDDGFTLLLILMHLLWDTNLNTHHFGYDCLEYGPKSISHFKWPWTHKPTQLQWIAISLLSPIITAESV